MVMSTRMWSVASTRAMDGHVGLNTRPGIVDMALIAVRAVSSLARPKMCQQVISEIKKLLSNSERRSAMQHRLGALGGARNGSSRCLGVAALRLAVPEDTSLLECVVELTGRSVCDHAPAFLCLFGPRLSCSAVSLDCPCCATGSGHQLKRCNVRGERAAEGVGKVTRTKVYSASLFRGTGRGGGGGKGI